MWNLKLWSLKPTKHLTWKTFETWSYLYHFISFCPNPISENSHFHSSFDTIDLFIEVLSRRWIPIFRNSALFDFSLTLACLFTSWRPKPDRFLPKTFKEAKVEADLHISSSKVDFLKVSGNRSGASSINHRWVFHLSIRLGVENILGPKVLSWALEEKLV